MTVFQKTSLAGLLAVMATLAAEAPFYADKTRLLYSLDEAGKSHAVRTPEQWRIRRGHIVANMEKVMGPFPKEPRPSLTVRVLDEVRFEGYRRRKLTYEARAGDPVPAYLFLPAGHGEKAPAVLALHPTGNLGKGIPAGAGGSPNRAYAHELALRGYVVLAPDYPYMGEAQADPYELGYVSGAMKGIYNHSRGVDLLASLEEVDAGRIGVIGHSLGGHNALFAAVFDERIRAVVTSCGFNAFPKYYGGDLTGWSSAKYMPRIAEIYAKDPARVPFDFPEVLAAIAPRPVYINAPVDDHNFEVAGVRDCLRAALPVYQKVFGAGDRLQAVHPRCGHDFPEEIRLASYEFLDRWLE